MCERQIEIAKIRGEFGDVPIVEYDGVGTPIDDGSFVAVPLYREWQLVAVSLWRKDRFYESLKKMIVASMPGLVGRPLH